MISKLENLKTALESQGLSLPMLAYHSWNTVDSIKNKSLTIEMLDDLYCGLISGAPFVNEKGHVDYVPGTGPSEKDKFTTESYLKLFFSLVEFSYAKHSKEEWLEKNKESEKWVEWIEEALTIEDEFKKNAESLLLNYRYQLIKEKHVFKN